MTHISDDVIDRFVQHLETPMGHAAGTDKPMCDFCHKQPTVTPQINFCSDCGRGREYELDTNGRPVKRKSLAEATAEMLNNVKADAEPTPITDLLGAARAGVKMDTPKTDPPQQLTKEFLEASDLESKTPIATANAHQPGGNHYIKHGSDGQEQHWDRMWRLVGPGWFIGNITKYAERALDKNGLQDIDKVIHYAQKYRELVAAWLDGSGPPPGEQDVQAFAEKFAAPLTQEK